MLIVLSFDTVFFSLGAFLGVEKVSTMIKSGLIGKSGSVLIYSLLFFVYLKFIEKETDSEKSATFKDVFYSLSYRQKFEIVEKEIKDSRFRYQKLADMTPIGIFFTKVDGYTTYVNPRWSAISGMPQKEALGFGWLNAVHPDDRSKTGKGWEIATKNRKSSYAQYRFLHEDGTVRWVLGRAMQDYDSSNKLIGYIGTITDITDLINYEKDLKSAKIKAEESSRLKSMFLHNLSHEIRTPLNAICGFSEFLSEDNLTIEEKENYINIIHQSSNQLLKIITDILTISTIESNQVEIHRDTVIIDDIFNKLRKKYSKEAEDKGIELKFKKSESCFNQKLFTDKFKLVEILENLISNSIKFTNKGYVEVGCTIKESKIEFYVKDTGFGIKKELVEKIFQPFSQADDNIQSEFGGTGLGLAIARAFVELLGGKIRLASIPNVETVFCFNIRSDLNKSE